LGLNPFLLSELQGLDPEMEKKSANYISRQKTGFSAMEGKQCI
jgi:hypothetical protein